MYDIDKIIKDFEADLKNKTKEEAEKVANQETEKKKSKAEEDLHPY